MYTTMLLTFIFALKYGISDMEIARKITINDVQLSNFVIITEIAAYITLLVR